MNQILVNQYQYKLLPKSIKLIKFYENYRHVQNTITYNNTYLLLHLIINIATIT